MRKDIKNNWRNVVISKEKSILSAIRHMDEEGLRVLLIIDNLERLCGIITDGDIRRYILKNGSLENNVEHIMNKNPVTAFAEETRDQLLAKMNSSGILHLPIIDNNNRLVGLETLDSIYTGKNRDNMVVFMAGGIGKRLHPLTVNCPKPLLKVGDKPISEILLEVFIKSGFKNFYFSVNYKSDMIREYYGSGKKWGIEIDYIEENNMLGTVGSLSLLSSLPDKPFFVVNADILTNVDFGHILDYHLSQDKKSYATICVRQHQISIPFGVVHINEDDHSLFKIEEKPIQNYFVSTGVYILEPDILKHLSYNSFCDMPQFLTHLVEKGLHISTFPIREYWLDIGHHDNLFQAATDYTELFSS